MDKYLFEGALSVKACLLSGNRKVEQIIIDLNKKNKDISFIIKTADKLNIKVVRKTNVEIEKLASGQTHGGILCYAGERSYQKIEDVTRREKYFLCILEGIEDPFNFGYCLRTLLAAGCDGVIIPKRNWMSASSIVAKSSAGASEYLNIIPTDDWEAIFKTIKNTGGKVFCANRSNALSIYENSYCKSTVIAIGGEKRGLSKQILAHSEQNIYIPYGSEFRNAINGSSATAIIAFEVLRQRKNGE